MISGSGHFRTRYLLDTGLTATPFRRFWMAVLLVALVALPFTLPNFWLGIVNLTCLAIIGAVALNLVTGVSGQLSLGHAGFLAIGAYSTAFLTRQFDAPLWATLPAAAIAGALVGLLVGVPALRLRGLYLSVSTLAAYFIILSLATEYQSIVGGSSGFLIPTPWVGPWMIKGERAWYAVLLVAATLALVMGTNLLRSHVGRAWLTLRERELAAGALGIDVRRYRLLAFVLSTALTSVAGCLASYYNGFVAVEAFAFLVTIQYLAMVVVGGLGSMLGSVYGALFVTLLPYGVERVIQGLPFRAALENQLFGVQVAVFGLLMLGFLTFEPGGLVTIWLRCRTYFELWPFKHRPVES